MKLLSSGNVYKNFIVMAIPLVLSGLLSQAFHMIDTIIVGKMIGENAVAALGATASLIEVVSSMFWGLGTGSALYIATLYGKGEKTRLVNTVKLTLWAYFLFALLVSAFLIIFYKPIFAFLKVDADIYTDAFIYYIIYVASLAVIVLNSCAGYIMHALGNSLFPLLMSILSSIANIAGNILLVAFTPLGVAGVAIATTVSATLTMIFYIFKFKKVFREFGYTGQKLFFDRLATKECLRYGLPCMLQQMSMYISSFAVSPMVNALGSSATAGYTVGMRVYSINSSVYQNSSKCVSNYSAQCMGEKKYGKINTGIKAGFLQATVLLLPFAFVCYIFPEQIASLFFKSGSSQESISIACMFAKYCLPFIIFGIFNNLFHSLFKGVKAMKSVLVSTITYTVVRIIASFLLSPGYGMPGIYTALSIAWIAEAIVISVIYFTGIWKSKALKEYEAKTEAV
ncbi:MAG: MATE family efflux transporter [Clostridia bacterium]|nr:MATE family efflux transporter [Clostridia bacterium]